ncbi:MULTISPECIES: thymidine phosphorylase [unclassified Wenzhouxiangella]|uniref:thymidine phosphorylase n=1 Tax=unclassified Wenzhouxiangella TaxID=2613841 RepID=UPI000E32C2E6|nr:MULTISPECIES: thymidine phosphorylase [unclassified Wenzhouxiangella]RFF26865.1 thymidine phosphorylase [Wenzhouxiangella sp. 15181]RFP68481.1 thymidine phosphorylase [Wenzhouxiangella sp. 15190]
MQFREILRQKRDGRALDAAAIEQLVEGITDGSLGDEQLGAFAMAVFLNGMEDGECVSLTRSMRDSGQVLRWDDPALPGPVLDKHSTGGVGDATSLLVAPIVAACGGFVPMIAGRGLGHTGGTVDKLAAIPGYEVSPPTARFQEIVRDIGCAMIGQTADLAPADRRLYAVRDVTATVESVPLIVASILSKKLAEGLEGLVLDIKTGNGAVMTDPDEARYLARRLTEVGTLAGVRTHALLTDMSQPLADSAGNALELAEVVDCLRGQPRRDTLMTLSRELAIETLLAGRLAEDRDTARQQVESAIESGRAAERFAAMVGELGGPSDLIERPDKYLPEAPVVEDVYADRPGFVASCDVRAIGMAVVDLGGGRRSADDRIDPAVGLSGLAQIGDDVGTDRPLARIHARSADDAERAATAVRDACRISEQPAERPELVSERLTPGES